VTDLANHGVPRTLVLGIGNPSRGDDALGPLLLDRLAALDLPDVELLTDFQLGPEHALDLVGRERVIFVDAAAQGEAPFRFAPLSPAHDASALTHVLSPEAVLDVFVTVTRLTLPSAFVLAIRGSEFGLGKPLSPAAAAHLEAALAFLVPRLSAREPALE
jgi:hydrogenase maturation protease